jgi:hypothetical protein
VRLSTTPIVAVSSERPHDAPSSGRATTVLERRLEGWPKGWLG